jgi:predicted transcriptional regulator
MPKLKRFSGWLDAKTLEKLKEIGKEQDRPISWLIRRAVEKFVAETKKESK